MKFISSFVILSSLVLLTNATQILIMNFSFSLYLAEVIPQNLDSQKTYEDFIEKIWDQAEFLASGRIYGFKFSYFSPVSWKTPKGEFSVMPQAKISRGNPQLSIRKVQKISPSHYEVQVRYVLTPEETARFRKFQERADTLSPSKGISEFNNTKFFFEESLNNSFYSAIQTYAQEKNLSQFEGQFLIKENNPLIIKSAKVIQYSQIKLIVENPIPLSH